MSRRLLLRVLAVVVLAPVFTEIQLMRAINKPDARTVERANLTETGPFPWIMRYLFLAPDGVDTKLRVWATTNQYAIATYLWNDDIGFVVLAKNADGWHRLSSGWGGPPNAYALAGYGIPQEFANDLWQEFMRSRNHFYSVF